MKKSMLVAAALVGLGIAGGVTVAVLRDSPGRPESLAPVTRSLPVTIGDQTFTLVDGVATRNAPPGSATAQTVRVVDQQISGDVSGDGRPDAALLISDDPGGSGTFYYAALALAGNGGWHATNVVPLGDRIKPEGIDFTDGRFVYRFLERRPGEPMAAAPSVRRAVPIQFDAASGRITAAE